MLPDRPEVMATAGAYVRDAIRPFVNGRFTDMLLAVMQHPAMLYSLDNDESVGPSSPSVPPLRTTMFRSPAAPRYTTVASTNS